MTIFDLITLAIVALSALSGFNRGVVAEILGLFAVALSAMATIAFLPATAPIVRHFMHAGWPSAVTAAVLTFAIVFMFLRLISATLTNSLNRSALGGMNRVGGLLFGALRGVVFLGLLALLFTRVTPQEQRPDWVTGGATYPLAMKAGEALQGFLPKKLDLTGGFGDKLTRSISDEGAKTEQEETRVEPAAPEHADRPTVRHSNPSSEGAKARDHGYTRHARESVDALVERSK